MSVKRGTAARPSEAGHLLGGKEGKKHVEVRTVVRGNLSEKKRERLKPVWEKARREFEEKLNAENAVLPGLEKADAVNRFFMEGAEHTVQWTYYERLDPRTVLRFLFLPSKEREYLQHNDSTFTLIEAMREDLEKLKPTYVRKMEGETYTVEGLQLEALENVLSWMYSLSVCQDEVERKRCLWELWGSIIGFGATSEEKYADLYRESPDPEFDARVREKYERQTEKNLSEAVRDAAKELKRTAMEQEHCKERLKKQSQRKAKRKSGTK